MQLRHALGKSKTEKRHTNRCIEQEATIQCFLLSPIKCTKNVQERVHSYLTASSVSLRDSDF